MATFTHKIQLLLDDHQHRALLTLAQTRGKTLSALPREAVVEQLLREARRAARQKALEEIGAMTLSVADWSEMEREIERTHAGGRKHT